MKVTLAAALALSTAAFASSASADRFVVLGASDNASYVANLDSRVDRPDGAVLYEVEIGRYRGRQAHFELVSLEADCAKGQMRVAKTHEMVSPTFEAAPPRLGMPGWVTPTKGSLEATYLQAGCAPTFPKASVVDTGDGDHDYRPALEAGLRAHLGLKPTDPLPAFGRGGR